MSGKTFAIIIIAAVFLTGMIILGVKVIIPGIKRKKLAEAWSAIAKQAKLNLTPEYIQTELQKVTSEDLDTLITFSKYLQAKKIGQAVMMLADIEKILNKTNLGKIDTYLAALIGTPKK